MVGVLQLSLFLDVLGGVVRIDVVLLDELLAVDIELVKVCLLGCIIKLVQLSTVEGWQLSVLPIGLIGHSTPASGRHDQDKLLLVVAEAIREFAKLDLLFEGLDGGVV